jgi:DNA-binding CsgD family transcriptional regulator
MDSDVLFSDAIRAGTDLQHNPEPLPATLLQDPAAPQTSLVSCSSVLPFSFGDHGAKLVLDENRRVIWASAGATLLASGQSCISVANGLFGGRTRYSDLLLRDLCASAQDSGDRIVEMLIAPESSQAPELFVRAESHPVSGERFILLTVRNLARDLEGLPDLGRLYGLTRTEQQVTRMMIQGQSVTEIGSRLNKSVLTVRTHVKRVYSKLDVRTKEQLFSTVMKLMVD